MVGGTAPGNRVRGTDGDDVIVTSGASVWAGGGDDVICVARPAADRGGDHRRR